MADFLRQFLRDESAATAIEYGLIATLISLAMLAGFSHLASSVSALWDGNSSKISEALE